MSTTDTTLRTLDMSRESIDHLLIAAQRSRSIAAEGGYLDLMSDVLGIKGTGTDPWLGDERTITMLQRTSSGEIPLDRSLWMNLASMVDSSLNWQLSLSLRGFRMPTVAEVLDAPPAVVTSLQDLI